ncbi:hypothetical protein GGI02_004005 [Coemansia sp. RSA 2322]|uniref:Globin-sensor domain-containing protein n=1 Tax=Coemansia thaxteri TaxID=2663907 RepID=A0A9W8BDB2_9FUNG|nr:hypothetical protein H4R26_005238 [Coemansia thaxteri]KAJ2467531.1 hypothetical protein GGI02_004005 [Coemansia sp. RSA 2322]KAJ2483723.1 hypothetical protein EV174_002871 [Coemansia sp. RSA 2320]
MSAKRMHIDRDRLYTDLQYRFDYVSQFIGFTEVDQELIHRSASVVSGLVPTIVDAVYDRLSNYDATWSHFAQDQDGMQIKQTAERGGYNGSQVSIESEVIKFRKVMLTKYLKKLVTSEWNLSYLKYLDWVGHIHTTTPLKRSNINVEYIHCNALFGYLSSVVLGALAKVTEWDADTRDGIIGAYNRFFWLQNDLFSRYYVKDQVLTDKEKAAVAAEKKEKEDEMRRRLRMESMLNAAVGLAAGSILATVGFKYLARG